MPRYLDPCCEEHQGGKTDEKRKEELEKLLKAVWALKRETFQLLAKAHCKNTIVVGPVEVFNVKDSVEGVREVMDDGVHLNTGALGVLKDYGMLSPRQRRTWRPGRRGRQRGPARP
jgi:hypothetical protein